jgi:hypothetical protein
MGFEKQQNNKESLLLFEREGDLEDEFWELD